MDLFRYLMVKNGHNYLKDDDLFDYVLAKGGGGTYAIFEGTSINANNTRRGKMKLTLKGNTSQTGTPTPSTPIDVNVVSGDNEIVVCGKNLLGLTDGTYSNNGITAEVSNGTITLNGTATGSTSFIEINLLQKATFNNESYTVSLNNPTVATDSSTEFRLYAIDNSYLSVYLDVINNKKTTTTNRTYTRVQIKTPVGVSYNDFIMKPQLELGTATPYELYQSQSYPINLPVENLFDTVNIVDGEYYNTSGNEVLNGDFFRMANYVNCYGISNITISGASTSYAQLIFYDENKNFLDYWGVRDRTIAVPNNAYYFRASALKSEKDTVMIEKGSKANHYTPYGTTPIELCKIGTYQDYFTKNSDGQWCKYNAIGKVVLDGSENWTYYRDIAGSNLFRMPFANYTKNVTCYSNNYKGIAGTSGRTNFNIYLLESANSSNLDILDNRFTSVSDFNIWLSTHNTQVDYVLASPYLSLIEDNNLIEQLDNLQNAMSYSGTTNINQVNDDLPANMQAQILVEE